MAVTRQTTRTSNNNKTSPTIKLRCIYPYPVAPAAAVRNKRSYRCLPALVTSPVTLTIRLGADRPKKGTVVRFTLRDGKAVKAEVVG
ncbi:hypothetical protein H2200_007617 [Cladophialophora chaetospira]|uniref:Uncharacterized protein n=1 Tax=Cladophialophora chaetospira TaxID=386627 RepID=A0AA38X661_9EURO|nr:hypothetical protein H2200_007617 [Cladophialophora chaetospira]